MLSSRSILDFFGRATARCFRAATCCVLVLAVSASPAAADWLVTLEGKLIETDGPWIIDGDLVAYVDAAGDLQTLQLTDVDLEGSAETTAMKRGEAYTPDKVALAADKATGKAEAKGSSADEGGDGKPKITLYETSWCGYCRKTRKLLDSLGADFVAKDIEKSREAMAEYRKKSRGRGGVPLIDFDGKVVRGYREQDIRRLAREVEQRRAGS
ncbi:MAG: glutaredoxin family protein [Acidobacteriota bacterium]